MWKFRICWRQREKADGSGGSLPGLYNRSDALKISKYLRKNFPDFIFWINTIKSIPINKKDMVRS
jgi:hypothetical protein